MDKYYVCSELPEVFKIADKMFKKKEPKYATKTPERELKPGPRIDTTYTGGPIKVTQKYYDKKVAKHERKRQQEIETCKMQIMQLLAERDRLKGKLARLNPLKKKDAKKIANINYVLDEIAKEVEFLGVKSGVSVSELDHGTRFKRFIGRIANKAKKIFNKVKNFFSNHINDIIACVVGIGAPIASLFAATATRSKNPN